MGKAIYITIILITAAIIGLMFYLSLQINYPENISETQNKTTGNVNNTTNETTIRNTILEESIKSNNPKKCLELNNKLEQEQCNVIIIATKAVRENNSNFCDEISAQTGKAFCINNTNH